MFSVEILPEPEKIGCVPAHLLGAVREGLSAADREFLSGGSSEPLRTNEFLDRGWVNSSEEQRRPFYALIDALMEPVKDYLDKPLGAVYVDIDTRPVKPGFAQRAQGRGRADLWHRDGIKNVFAVSDKLTTQCVYGQIDMEKLPMYRGSSQRSDTRWIERLLSSLTDSELRRLGLEITSFKPAELVAIGGVMHRSRSNTRKHSIQKTFAKVSAYTQASSAVS